MVIIPTEKRIDWKNPPVILIGIIVLNILIFAFYQSQDMQKLTDAIEVYKGHNLIEIEQEAYQHYLEQKGEPNNLEQEEFDKPMMLYQVALDVEFEDFLKKDGFDYIDSEQLKFWQIQRSKVNKILAGLSTRALGLKPNNISIITLFSHQFLHGGIMHLVGNLVFLLLVGFTVEASLGGLRFLSYYLISGICSGLTFSLIDLWSGNGSISLVGASGSISGVMAMYLALYKFKKIEFFYWLFVFTGYFRAAAIVVLPMYILKEVYFLFAYEGSNVAYTAHIGGFISGALLILITQRLASQAIDVDYLEGKEQVVDPYRAELNDLYNRIGRCDFKTAWQQIKVMRKQYGQRPELAEIKFNLLIVLAPEKVNEYLTNKFGKSGGFKRIVTAQANLWGKLKEDAKAAISTPTKIALAANLLEFEHARAAESVLSDIVKTNDCPATDLAVIARNIALHYQSCGRTDKAKVFYQQAEQFIRKPVSAEQGGR